jgi:long-chain acyl-CoA synthetase
VFGMTVGMNATVHHGGAMVLVPNPRDLQALVEAVVRERVTIFPGVPSMYNALVNHPGIERLDVRSVKSCFSGSAPMPPDVLQRFETLTGARIVEGFGMSETSPVTHVNPLLGLRKIGSVGIPVSDTDARVVSADEGVVSSDACGVSADDGQAELPQGQEGELIVRGPQVMAGYWNRPEETANALRKGWMHTGDLAVMDGDGYFRIVGRKKDMINSGGFKVYPDEVDGVLAANPAVLEAATIGVPNERRGEIVKSFVVLRPGAHASVDELKAHCRASLAPYKVPSEIEFLSELPKSTVLKVLRRELRERELAKRGTK